MKNALLAKLAAARAVVNTIEFGTPEWEPSMQVVRDLVDEYNAAFPPAPWTDRQWADMMSR